MDSKIFNSLFKILLEEKDIEVSISQELEVWNDAADSNQKNINKFFKEFIFDYDIFFELLEKSDALGDNHELKLFLIDEKIIMNGKTFITGTWEDEEHEEPKEKSFKWIFDKEGNILKIE